MSERCPAVAGYAVVPSRLHEARSRADVTAQVLDEVARALADVSVPTGRPDTAHRCAELLRELSLGVAVTAGSIRSSGAAVGAAGTLYSLTDAAAVS